MPSDRPLMSSCPRSETNLRLRLRQRQKEREKSDAILKKPKKKNLSHTKEMSDIFGGWEKPWLHRCVESQHVRAAGGLVNTQRLETDNSPRLSNSSSLVFSWESFCYPHITIVKWYRYLLFFLFLAMWSCHNKEGFPSGIKNEASHELPENTHTQKNTSLICHSARRGE